MCRLLALWSKQGKKRSFRHLIHDWLEAWVRATKFDPQLVNAFGLSKSNASHSDGWGIVALGFNQDYEKKWLQLNLDLDPVYSYRISTLTRLALGTPFFKSVNQILLAHARRASVNTPISFQQVQPLFIQDNKGSVNIYLSHNGSIHSKIVNDAIDKEFQLKPMELSHFSDTQVLSLFIKQRLRELDIQTLNSVKEFWSQVFQEIVELHQEQDLSYQMQLIILEIVNHKPQFVICSALSKRSSKYLPYYQFFTGKRDNFHLICSSSVTDYFEQEHMAKTWDLNAISNNTIANLTIDGEFYYRDI